MDYYNAIELVNRIKNATRGTEKDHVNIALRTLLTSLRGWPVDSIEELMSSAEILLGEIGTSLGGGRYLIKEGIPALPLQELVAHLTKVRKRWLAEPYLVTLDPSRVVHIHQ